MERKFPYESKAQFYKKYNKKLKKKYRQRKYFEKAAKLQARQLERGDLLKEGISVKSVQGEPNGMSVTEERAEINQNQNEITESCIIQQGSKDILSIEETPEEIENNLPVQPHDVDVEEIMETCHEEDLKEEGVKQKPKQLLSVEESHVEIGEGKEIKQRNSTKQIAKENTQQPSKGENILATNGVKEIDMSSIVKYRKFVGSGTFGTCNLARYRGITVILKEFTLGGEHRITSADRLKMEVLHEANIISLL